VIVRPDSRRDVALDPPIRFAPDSLVEENGFEPLVPRRKTRLRPGSQKSVERQLDARDEAWPTGRQRSQAMLPLRERGTSHPRSVVLGIARQQASAKVSICSMTGPRLVARDRWFESISLQPALRENSAFSVKYERFRSSRSVFVQASTSARKPILVESRTMRSAASGGVSKARTSKIAPT
jgi:hypothetical protein